MNEGLSEPALLSAMGIEARPAPEAPAPKEKRRKNAAAAPKRPALLPLERDLERRACALAKNLGYIALKLTGLTGIPDRLFIGPAGVCLFVEFKRPGGGILSPAQKYWITTIKALGHRVEVINTWEHAKWVIERL